MPASAFLNYLFEAHFANGDIVTQTQDDVSTLFPPEAKKSAFSDVLEKAKASDVVSFGLFSDEHEHTYAVNLQTGHFEIDGIPFRAGEEVPPEGSKLRLIYYRRVSRHYTPSGEEIATGIVFHFGWQTNTEDGRNIKQTVAVE